MLSHQEDASLLLTLISASSAEVPAPDAPARRRSLLTADAPEVAGSLATTVVSGELLRQRGSRWEAAAVCASAGWCLAAAVPYQLAGC